MKSNEEHFTMTALDVDSRTTLFLNANVHCTTFKITITY